MTSRRTGTTWVFVSVRRAVGQDVVETERLSDGVPTNRNDTSRSNHRRDGVTFLSVCRWNDRRRDIRVRTGLSVVSSSVTERPLHRSVEQSRDTGVYGLDFWLGHEGGVLLIR